MKVYGFTCSCLWIGGSGLVKAKNKAEAVELINDSYLKEYRGFIPVKEDDLTEVINAGEVLILTNGDY